LRAGPPATLRKRACSRSDAGREVEKREYPFVEGRSGNAILGRNPFTQRDLVGSGSGDYWMDSLHPQPILRANIPSLFSTSLPFT